MDQGFVARTAAALSAAAVRRGIAEDDAWKAIIAGPGVTASDGPEGQISRPEVALSSITQVFRLDAMHRTLLGLAVAGSSARRSQIRQQRR